MVNKSSLVCGSGSCLGGAGQIIAKGMAGQGCNLLVGFFYHQIKIRVKDNRPGGAGGPIPDPQPIRYDPERDVTDDYNLVDVYITFKWPFMDEHKEMKFIMERRWANVVVNRINQINTFNEQFVVKIQDLKDNFKVKFTDFKDKFGVKWKK